MPGAVITFSQAFVGRLGDWLINESLPDSFRLTKVGKPKKLHCDRNESGYGISTPECHIEEHIEGCAACLPGKEARKQMRATTCRS